MGKFLSELPSADWKLFAAFIDFPDVYSRRRSTKCCEMSDTNIRGGHFPSSARTEVYDVGNFRDREFYSTVLLFLLCSTVDKYKSADSASRIRNRQFNNRSRCFRPVLWGYGLFPDPKTIDNLWMETLTVNLTLKLSRN